ncbi:MAG: outer membrane beta-barrel domain-containing protein [Deltaproteobacteria bacterium]|nr:outer membrane beta-barrel domain-containing protein [Deltaproteobacteria bacterium]
MNVIARALMLVALAAVVVAPLSAHSAEPEKVVVRNRKFSSDGKFEASVNVGFSVANYLTSHYNLVGSGAYNLTENWALQVEGGYALSGHTSVAQAASDTIVKDNPNRSAKEVDDFSDLWQMTWNVTGAVRWTPIYGKINVAAELPVHFQFYLLLGGGAGGMTRDSLVYCVGARPASGTVTCVTDPQEPTELKALHESAVKPVLLGGFGMKLFITQWAGLRLEVRDMAFPDSFREDINRALAEGDSAVLDGNSATQGVNAASPGFTHLVFAQVGAVFTF